MVKPYVFFIVIICCLFSCDKDNNELCGKTGQFKDFLGQDGCYLLIEDNAGAYYSATNLNDFGLNPVDGMKVKFSYQPLQTQSACLLAQEVQLVCLELQ